MKNYVLSIALFLFSIALSLVYFMDPWFPIIEPFIYWLPYISFAGVVAGLVVILIEVFRKNE